MNKPDRILAQELLEREVLDLAAGKIIGTVVDFALTREGHVHQIGVLPLAWYSGGKGLAPAGIISVTQERICIQDESALGVFDPDGEKVFSALFDESLHGKSVLQQDGEQLGRLADFSFNLTDGKITDLIVVDLEGKRVRVPVSAFKTVGLHYIVVEKTAAPEPMADVETAVKPAASAIAPVTQRMEADPAGVSPEDSAESCASAVELEAIIPETASERDVARPTSTLTAPAAAPSAPVPAPSPEGITRTEEKAALFGEIQPKLELSKFDQKKRDYLRGKAAHRDLKDQEGQLLAAKGEALTDNKLDQIVAAGMLGEVFVEMTLNK